MQLTEDIAISVKCKCANPIWLKHVMFMDMTYKWNSEID